MRLVQLFTADSYLINEIVCRVMRILEEPETDLHPRAAQALLKHVSALRDQKISARILLISLSTPLRHIASLAEAEEGVFAGDCEPA